MPQTKAAEGRVIAAHGRHYIVELPDGSQRKCFPRGKRSEAAVGDKVTITPLAGNEGSIDRIHERNNLLYRSDDMRSKQFAANVDQLLIVVATEPPFSEDLAGRALAAAWSADIAPLVLLNKVDRAEKLAETRERLAWLHALAVPVVELQASDPCATRARLLPLLRGKTSLLLGQSAMGKSTILNALVPDARALTQEHSAALGAGKHTTTSTRMYALPDGNGDIIDSPGFQTFGLHHLDAADIERGFPDLHDGTSCRFHNCSHRHEPGCRVLERLAQGLIKPSRHELYKRLLAEHEAKSTY